jgi:DNA polymerase I-like protein with 3'-5' exonuclease and polymerase domains
MVSPERFDMYRNTAKSANFLSIYGGGPSALVKRVLGFLKDEELRRDQKRLYKICESVIQSIMGEFKVYTQWSRDQVRFAQTHGYVWTQWNGELARRRYLREIANLAWSNDPKRDKDRSTAEHGAGNTQIQGGAADLQVGALWPIVDWIRRDFVPARLLMTIYDSILLEVAEESVDEVVDFVSDRLTSYDIGNNVPLEVDVKVGRTWGSMKKYKRS